MIKVHSNQKGNGVLNFLSKSIWHFDSSLNYDYDITSIGILFLSLRFHACKPEYILKRMNKLSPKHQKILLVLIDVVNYEIMIEQLFINAYKYDFTVILSYSNEECAEYLKLIDNNFYKSTEFIKPKKENKFDNFIGLLPKMNKNDILSVKKGFINLRSFINSDTKTLCNVDGINKGKAEILQFYFNMKFKE